MPYGPRSGKIVCLLGTLLIRLFLTATFAKLINHPKPSEADIQIMDVGEWDTQGQYKDVVEAVREAVKGSDVRVYKIVKDGSRIEYWVVGVEGAHLVGVKALAVES